MDVAIVVSIVGVVSAVIVASVTAFYSYVSNRNKSKAEIFELKARAEGEVLANLRQSQEILKQMLQPLEDEVKILKNEIEKMRPFICKVQNCQNRKK